MEHPRTESARAHDDRDIIENAEDAPGGVGRSGGNLQRDVATKDELARATEPEAHTRPTKQDAIDHDQARPRNRARGV